MSFENCKYLSHWGTCQFPQIMNVEPGHKCDTSKGCGYYENKFIKLHISCHGDPSVGIWGDQTEVLIERRFIEPDRTASGEYIEADRKFIKEQITALFKELWDDPNTGCWFEDECLECHRLKTECVCRCMNCNQLIREHDNSKCQRIETP
jgi:hypothetical protein